MKSGIYQIENQVNGKCYVGSAVNLAKRWRGHFSALRRGQHENQHLQHAFDKYGELAFVFSILEHVEDHSQLIMREQQFLNTQKPEYNIAPTAGSSLGIRRSLETRRKMSGERNHNYGQRPSDETCAKISVALMGHPTSVETHAKISAALSGERNPNYGKHPSDETRAKQSAVRMGHPVSDETRAKMSAAHMGRPVSAETRAKLSAARKGKRLSKEHRQKISEALKGNSNLQGHRHSQESKRKMAEAHKGKRNHFYGKHHTAEARRKMSAAQKAYWRKRRASSG